VVRHFPRATQRHHKHTAALVAALLLSTGGAVLHQSQAADLDDRKSEVQKKIAQADKQLDESSAALRNATKRLLTAKLELADAKEHLTETREQLGEARALDRLMRERLRVAEDRLARARAELTQGEAAVVEQERELRRVVMSSYEQGDPALMGLSMVFTTQDPAQLAGRMNTSSTVANVSAAVLDQVEAARVLLTVREEEIQAAKQEVAGLRRDAAENLERRRDLEAQAQTARVRVGELVSERVSARGDAVRAKARDLKELRRLEAERQRIERLILARASVGRGLKGSGSGFLSMPVSGYITSPYGWRTHPIWGYRSLHDGIDFGAGCGTPVRAAASGKVIAAYFQSAWGNRIIIDHGVQKGVGVATISNHLSGYAVSVGQRVERGQTIGYVGSTGWSTGCHLHYSVLNNGSAVDPMGWL
jgi:murein DD-endopeptidase MepM/ murein hydrolase activator NlpD